MGMPCRSVTNFAPPDCAPRDVVYSTGEGDDIVTCTFGTDDCSIWHLIWGWTSEGAAHSARFETVPGEYLPDVHAVHNGGEMPGETEGAFAVGIDGEAPRVLVIRGGTVALRDTDSPLSDARLSSLAAPMERLVNSLPEGFNDRATALTETDSPWSSCVSESIGIGTGVGCAAGLTVGVLSGGVALPKALTVGCGGGAALGLVGGLVFC